MDVNKQRFLHYLEFYKTIYDMNEDDRPDDEILQNHILCDEWVRKYLLNQKKERKELERQTTKSKKHETQKVNF